MMDNKDPGCPILQPQTGLIDLLLSGLDMCVYTIVIADAGPQGIYLQHHPCGLYATARPASHPSSLKISTRKSRHGRNPGS